MSKTRVMEAATGYLELSMPHEAAEEIENLPPEAKTDMDVLRLRLEIYRQVEAWELMETVARALVRGNPSQEVFRIALASALEHLHGPQSAYKSLEEAGFATPRMRYLMGRYACRFQDPALAIQCITEAISESPNLRIVALDDPDLNPIWNYIWSKT